MGVRHPSKPAWFRFTFALGALSLVSFGLAACSSGGSGTKTPVPTLAAQSAAPTPSRAATGAPGSAASGSACGLVTVDEVTTAAGKPMAVSGDAGTICTFSAVADPSIVVYVQIYNDKASMGTMTQIEGGSDHLTGLGDDAFWNSTLGTVFVQKGGRGFSVAWPSLANLTASPDAVKADMVTLAKGALARF